VTPDPRESMSEVPDVVREEVPAPTPLEEDTSIPDPDQSGEEVVHALADLDDEGEGVAGGDAG
jgi:hypothetical protein